MSTFQAIPCLMARGVLGSAGFTKIDITAFLREPSSNHPFDLRTHFQSFGGTAAAQLRSLADRMFRSDPISDEEVLIQGREALSSFAVSMANNGEPVNAVGSQQNGWLTQFRWFQNSSKPNEDIYVLRAELVDKSGAKLNLDEIRTKHSNLERIVSEVIEQIENDDERELWKSVEEMENDLFSACDSSIGLLEIKDEQALRRSMIKLVNNSISSPDNKVREMARWIIWQSSVQLGCQSASMHELYKSRVLPLWIQHTIPVITTSQISMDEACTVFDVCMECNAASPIFKLNEAADQHPADFVTTILGAAMHVGFSAPIFFQRDLRLCSPEYGKKARTVDMKGKIRATIDSGIYNINVEGDALSLDLGTEEQGLLEFIHAKAPDQVHISIGAQIYDSSITGSLRDHFVEFMNRLADRTAIINKISFQMASGRFADPDVINELSEMGSIARQWYRIGGIGVKLDSAILPESEYGRSEVLEVDLRVLDVDDGCGNNKSILNKLRALFRRLNFENSQSTVSDFVKPRAIYRDYPRASVGGFDLGDLTRW